MEQLILFNNSTVENLISSPLTDQVRGGKSNMSMETMADQTARFFGDLILNSEGAGFASFRFRKKDRTFWNLKDSSTFNIICCGDGRTYKLLLKDEAADQSEMDYSWQAKIPTAAGFHNTEILIAALKPFYRGREMKDILQFDASRIVEIGFQINDKKEGPFEMKVKSVECF